MPSEREVGGYEREQSNFGMFVMIAVVVVGFVGMAWAFVFMARTDDDRRAFIRQCIEFQSVDRCGELYVWDRRDLVKK